jgi:hypothetical protein
MPGKNRPTKIIRKKAYEDVYANKGALLREEDIPDYSDEKHRDLYIRVYTQVRNSYHAFESLYNDMIEVFGK